MQIKRQAFVSVFGSESPEKRKQREQLGIEVAAFLKAGGKIQQIPIGKSADANWGIYSLQSNPRILGDDK